MSGGRAPNIKSLSLPANESLSGRGTLFLSMDDLDCRIRNCVGVVTDTGIGKPRGIHVRDAGSMHNRTAETVCITGGTGGPAGSSGPC
jgi:hypothetical protein